MENIQQVAKPSAMMNEAPMNHLTLSDRLKSYKRTPGSFLVMLLVVLSAVATIAALVFLILYIFNRRHAVNIFCYKDKICLKLLSKSTH